MSNLSHVCFDEHCVAFACEDLPPECVNTANDSSFCLLFNGFRPNQATTDVLRTLRIISELAIEVADPTNAVAIVSFDTQRAYPSIRGLAAGSIDLMIWPMIVARPPSMNSCRRWTSSVLHLTVVQKVGRNWRRTSRVPRRTPFFAGAWPPESADRQ